MATRTCPPEPRGPNHRLEGFANGRHPALDEWLHSRARSSEGLSARTYVVCPAHAPTRVIGYYALSTAMEKRTAMPNAKLRQGMPEEVPLLLIGRLAVDQGFQGTGLGTALLVDAMERCLAIGRVAGVRALVAQAIDEKALAFYLRHGFIKAPALGERAVLLPMETLRALWQDA